MNYLKYIKLNQNKTKKFKIIQFFLEKKYLKLYYIILNNYIYFKLK